MPVPSDLHVCPECLQRSVIKSHILGSVSYLCTVATCDWCVEVGSPEYDHYVKEQMKRLDNEHPVSTTT